MIILLVLTLVARAQTDPWTVPSQYRLDTDRGRELKVQTQLLREYRKMEVGSPNRVIEGWSLFEAQDNQPYWRLKVTWVQSGVLKEQWVSQANYNQTWSTASVVALAVAPTIDVYNPDDALATEGTALDILSAIQALGGGGAITVALARHDYTVTPVTSAAYVQLVASLSDDVTRMNIFDSSGRTLYLAVGAPASEVDQFYIVPGGNGLVPLTIASGSRVAIKAVGTTANKGELSVTFIK